MVPNSFMERTSILGRPLANVLERVRPILRIEDLGCCDRPPTPSSKGCFVDNLGVPLLKGFLHVAVTQNLPSLTRRLLSLGLVIDAKYFPSVWTNH